MKHQKKSDKNIYTKYDYIYIYSKTAVIAGTFAAVSMSLSLFLGFMITLISHDHLDISSQICLVLFVLSLPVVLHNIKHYRTIQRRLRGRHADDIDDIVSQTVLPTKKQLWGGIIILAFLILVIFSLLFLMLWLMVSYYKNIFLILFVFLGILSLPVLAVMLIYIRLLPIAEN